MNWIGLASPNKDVTTHARCPLILLMLPLCSVLLVLSACIYPTLPYGQRAIRSLWTDGHRFTVWAQPTNPAQAESEKCRWIRRRIAPDISIANLPSTIHHLLSVDAELLHHDIFPIDSQEHSYTYRQCYIIYYPHHLYFNSSLYQYYYFFFNVNCYLLLMPIEAK